MTVTCLSTNGWNHFEGSSKPSTLFVATTDGLVRLERSAANNDWRKTGHSFAGFHVAALLWVEQGQRLYVGLLPGGLHVSEDLGQTWRRCSAGIAEEKIYSLRCFGGGVDEILYAGVEPAGLYRSVDRGETWTELATLRRAPMHEKWQFPAPGHDPHLKSIAIDPRDSNVIYVGVEQGGLLKSEDGGKSWIDVDSFVDYSNFIYKDIHQVLLRPSNCDEVFMPTGLGLYHSKDCGKTWEHLTDSAFRIGYPDQLLFSPENDSVLFMSGAKDAPYHWIARKSALGTVVISEDAGRTWRAPRGGFPESRANVEAISLCAYPGGFDLFAGTTDGLVMMSSDRGENWCVIADEIAAVSKPTHDTLISGVAYGTEPPDGALNAP